MKPVFYKKFQKFILKVKDKVLFEKIKCEVDLIIDDPQKGKLLEHPFKKYKIRSEGFVYKNNSYRIAYTINKNADEMVFLLIDSRENFYEKLKRMM